MSTACISKNHWFKCYKRETSNELPNSSLCKTSDGPKMAPLVETQKAPESDVLVAEHPDLQYASTETNSNSSENNSDTQQDDKNSFNNLIDRIHIISNDLPYDQNLPQFPLLPQDYLPNFPMSDNLRRSFPRENFQAANMPVNGEQKLELDGLYHCQKCEFVGRNDDELHVHSRRHDPFECSECGLMSDTPENLKAHMKVEHPKIAASKREDFIVFHESDSVESPPESVESSPKNKKTTKAKTFEENIDKPRKTTCKLCNNFIGKCKREYYTHLRERHPDATLFCCHICPFIALYKHHFEYHVRNHYGSKPFECKECVYICVNRSMLNSHKKSHSNIYQYSCKNCQYMTKYLHSLKMHLRKYNHEPGQTLNPDGTVNKNAVIDTHGKRRGPKSKKRKSETDHTQEPESKKSKSPSPPPSPYLILPSPDIRFLCGTHIHNNFTGNLCVRAGPSEASNYVLHSPPIVGSSTFRCAHCEFVTGSWDIYQYHILSHGPQGNLTYGSFIPKFMEFPQQPYNFGQLGFGSIFNPDSFARNNSNQPTTVETRNGNEGRNMDVTNNDIHSQNPISSQKIYEMLVKTDQLIKGDSGHRLPIPPPLPPGNLSATFPRYIEEFNRRRREDEEYLKAIDFSPSPNGIPAVKREIPEYMNGIGSPSTKNPFDNGPLDLTIKQPTSPETKSPGTGALRRFGGLVGGAMNRTSSVSPKCENEGSKVATRKTNRRKGRAFKLNQYAMESEPLSDGAEAAFGSAIKKSVPRINFKPTLNATKWNGHASHEPKSSEVLPFPELAYTEPKCANPQTTGQKARDASKDCWCPHCDMYSTSARLQEYHSSYHSENDPFTCAKCGLRCNDKERFNQHIVLGSRINGNCINSIDECKS